jgi:hypothetical protein
MIDERLAEVRRLVHEHLNAAMIMVPLDDPMDPEMPIAEALAYLDRNEFDLALLRSPEVRIVYRDRLKQVGDANRGQAVKTKASSPRGDRLIEHSLELGEVARRLRTDAVPLLVVGRDGPEFIVTRADFTRPAGQAGVLAVLAALDAQLDELLQPYDAEAWELLEPERRVEIDELITRARARSEEVHRLGYLTLRERFELIRGLDLAGRFAVDLGNQGQHELVITIRNDIAHGRELGSGTNAIKALELAERLIDTCVELLTEASPQRASNSDHAF